MNFDNTKQKGQDFVNDSFFKDTFSINKKDIDCANDLLPKIGERVLEYVERIHKNNNFASIHEQCPGDSRGLQVVLKKYPHGNFCIKVGLSQPIVASVSDGCRNPGYKGESFYVLLEINGLSPEKRLLMKDNRTSRKAGRNDENELRTM